MRKDSLMTDELAGPRRFKETLDLIDAIAGPVEPVFGDIEFPEWLFSDVLVNELKPRSLLTEFLGKGYFSWPDGVPPPTTLKSPS